MSPACQPLPLWTSSPSGFVPAPFIQLAREARWLCRQGKIDAFEFLISWSSVS